MRLGSALAFGVFCTAVAATTANAYDKLTFDGKVVSVNSKQIEVNADQKTLTFLLGSDFKGVTSNDTGAASSLSALTPGTRVRVSYYKDTAFGSDHATKIVILNGFQLQMQTPSAQKY